MISRLLGPVVQRVTSLQRLHLGGVSGGVVGINVISDGVNVLVSALMPINTFGQCRWVALDQWFVS